MIILHINNIKLFMNHLLNQSTFDDFLLEEAVIKTYNTFVIDGHVEKEFFTKEEQEDYALCPYAFSRFGEMKKICFDLLKGKRLPLGFKFTLQLLPDKKEQLLMEYPQASALFALLLNIQYKENKLTLTTGVNYSSFTLDKECEKAWDSYIKKFLIANEIPFEE